DALHSLPLFSPLLRLIGLGYTGWFVVRYLVYAPNRRELFSQMGSLTREFFESTEAKPLPEVQAKPLPEVKTQPLPPAATRETVKLVDNELEQDFDLLIGVIRTIRNLRADADIKPGAKVPVILQSESESERKILDAGRPYIQDLGKVDNLTITPTLTEEQQKGVAGVTGTVQVIIPLAGIVEVDKLRAKLEKNLGKVEAEVKSLTGRLNNPGFVNNAPDSVVQGARDNLAEAEKQAEILQERLKRLQ
ncbi:MAG: CAAD domain-containing protein, partial [Chroococcales cyanobacterium]